MTDNGSEYITWRGKSAFAKELEKRGGDTSSLHRNILKLLGRLKGMRLGLQDAG